MSVYKRGKWYWMHDFVNGEQYRMTLGTRNWQEALRLHKEKLNEIAEGKIGSVGKVARQMFQAAADAYLEERRLHTAEKTRFMDEERCRPLRSFFGGLPLQRIKSETVVEYQIARSKAGVSGRTVNMEVGLLRRVMKKHKQMGATCRLCSDAFRAPRAVTGDDSRREGAPIADCANKAGLGHCPLCSGFGAEYHYARL